MALPFSTGHRVVRSLAALAGAAVLGALPACGCSGSTKDADDDPRSLEASSGVATASSATQTTSVAAFPTSTATSVPTWSETATASEEPTTTANPAGPDEPGAGAAPAEAGPAAPAAVEQVIEDYIEAFRAGRGEDGCAAMTPEAQQAVLARAAAEGLTTSSCAVAFEAAAESAGGATRTALAFATTDDVQVRGDHATATVDVFGQRYPIQLERHGSRWLVAELRPV